MPRINIDADRVTELVDQGKSIAQIAADQGCSSSTIRRRIKLLGAGSFGGFAAFSVGAGDEHEILTEPGAVAQLHAYREIVFTCVNMRADGVCQVPLRLFRTKPENLDAKTMFQTKTVSRKQLAHLWTKEALLPWLRSSDTVEEITGAHPFYALWQGGNPLMTGSQLRRLMSIHMDLVGATYAHLILNDDGVPEAMLILAPGTMRIVLSEDEAVVEKYIQKDPTTGEETTFLPEEIFRSYYPSPLNPLEGYSPAEAVGLSISLYHGFQTHENALLHNGAVPSTMILYGDGLGDTERRRLERWWKQNYQGPRRAGGTYVGSGNITVTQLGLSQKDMQFAEGGIATRDRIANAYRVPIPFFTETSTYSNAETAERSFAQYATVPSLKVLEDSINRDIVSLYPDPTLFAAFDDPVPSNLEAGRENATIMLTTDGVVFKNEIRQALSMAPLPELEGVMQERAKPVAVSVSAQAPQDAADAIIDEADIEDEESEKTARGLIAAISEEAARIAVRDALRAKHRHSTMTTRIPHEASAKVWFETGKAPCDCYSGKVAATPQGVTEPNPEFIAMLEGYFAGLSEDITKSMEEAISITPDSTLYDEVVWTDRLAVSSAPFLRGFLQVGAGEGLLKLRNTKAPPPVSEAFNLQHPGVLEYLSTEPLKFAQSVQATFDIQLRGELAAGLLEGESTAKLVKRIKGMVALYGKEQPMRIARTEEARAIGRGTLESYRQNPAVTGSKWLASADSCDFCLEMENRGNTVSVGGAYSPQGAEVQAIGDPARTLATDYEDVVSPPLHPNCTCTLIPVVL